MLQASAAERDLAWDRFLGQWPIERVESITLPEYSEWGNKKTFCYWLDKEAQILGTSWGFSPFKFGIFQLQPGKSAKEYKPGTKHKSDSEYAWYAKYGNTHDEAFEAVKQRILKVIEAAKNGELRIIGSMDLSRPVKWKIASLYQNRNDLPILPVFSKQALEFLANDTRKKSSTFQLQQRIQDMRGSVPFWKYFDVSLKKLADWESNPSATTTPDDDEDSDGFEPELEELNMSSATNMILYGPPGTGKTFFLQNVLIPRYRAQTPRPVGLTPIDFAEQSYWVVVTACMALLGGKASVNEVLKHPLFAAKARFQARSTTLHQQIWSCLQTHARKDSKTVQYAKRIEPLIFDKKEDSSWYLLPNWKTDCPEAVELTELWTTFSQNTPGLSGQAGNANIAQGIDRYSFVTFHQSYSYEDFVEGIRPNLDPDSEESELQYQVKQGVFRKICALAKVDPDQRYALFIDEINRGNIAKVFGELITLIEEDKRCTYNTQGRLVSGLEVTLPYSGERFGVPDNLDIYGTMNTADRSIALLDVALRRRFRFKELIPNADLIPGIDGKGNISDGEGNSINLRALLSLLNRRLLLLRDRDHLIGHSFLMKCRDIESLRIVIRDQVLPLLEEYFHEDFRRIQQLLGDLGPNQGEFPNAIVRSETLDPRVLLGIDDELNFEKKRFYRVSDSELWTGPVFRRIYGA